MGKWWSGGAARPYPGILALHFFFFKEAMITVLRRVDFGKRVTSFSFFPLNYWRGEIAGIKVYAAAIEEGVCFGDLSMAESKLLVLLRKSSILRYSFFREGNTEFIMKRPSCRKYCKKKTTNNPNVLCFSIDLL